MSVILDCSRLDYRKKKKQSQILQENGVSIYPLHVSSLDALQAYICQADISG